MKPELDVNAKRILLAVGWIMLTLLLMAYCALLAGACLAGCRLN